MQPAPDPSPPIERPGAIQFQGLEKIYRSGFFMTKVVGLKPIDLSVFQGEVFGFIGPNGAGKTTAIKILVGLHRATAGKAWLAGIPHDDPRCRQHLGFLPERPYFYTHLSGRELLDFYGRLFNLSAKERALRTDRLLERVELTRFADVPLGKYSKGMLQRVGLCQAILHDPEVIVLDEPMSGLDPSGRALVREIILEQRDLGRTVFFSSHVLHDVETLCDRVGILVDGTLRGVGRIEDLLENRVRLIECSFSGIKAGQVPGKHIRSDGERIWVHVSPNQLESVLAQVNQQGGKVLSVVPMRESLEQLLLDEMERAKPMNPKRMGVLA